MSQRSQKKPQKKPQNNPQQSQQNPPLFQQNLQLSEHDRLVRQGVALVFAAVLVLLITKVGGILLNVDRVWLKRLLNTLVYLVLGATGCLFYRFLGFSEEFGFTKRESWITGLGLGVCLALVFGVLPILFGGSLVGGHTVFLWDTFFYELFRNLLLIGPVEEFIFRSLFQGYLVKVFSRRPWIGVVCASVLFGLWHLVNGSWIQVIFASLLGLVFGFMKWKNPSCRYVGVALGHGLYDFLIYLITCFLI